MRIAELSGRSGTSIPSIKYYLREGLLRAGSVTGRNQADYDDTHVHRLRLIRALLDVGGLSIAAARDVLAAVDTPGLPGHRLLGTAHHAISPPPPRRDPNDAGWRAARAEVEALIARRGWLVAPDSPGIDAAADAIAAMRGLGQEDLLVLDTYAAAAERVADAEVGAVVARGEPTGMVQGVIIGTILGEAILCALRRLAQQHESARRVASSRPA
jgi:DNA-binding transcriptional MerR regulator